MISIIKKDMLSKKTRTLLGYVPSAVFPALIFPAIFLDSSGSFESIDNPKIYGAGLLSSVSESQECLEPKIKKIPISIDCIQQDYNITEPQPQLFITKSFKDLKKILNTYSQTRFTAAK